MRQNDKNDNINDTDESQSKTITALYLPGIKRSPISSLSNCGSSTHEDTLLTKLKIKTPKALAKKIKKKKKNKEEELNTLDNIKRHLDHIKKFINDNTETFPITYEETAEFLTLLIDIKTYHS